ncbi:MAG: suppressor of fused domain protein [Alphaproteobacteria bacterium]|nr:suppressor of fused domain protein [Alphaproteobacteria bacterium]
MNDGPEIGDAAAAAAILAHIRTHIGPVDSVFHEFDADGVGIDIHHVPPTKKRKAHTLITTGMSDEPMPKGPGVRYGELVMRLPSDWPMSDDALDADSAAWPIALLRALGRLPHEHGVGYDFGLCIDSVGLPFDLAAATGFAGVLLAPPVTVADAFWCLDAGDGKVIDFFGVVMLYPDEVALAKSEGVVGLAHKLDALKVNELMQPGRKRAA